MSGNLWLLLISILFLVGHVTSTGGSSFRPELTGPSMAYLKSTETFECNVSSSSSLTSLTVELIQNSSEVLATETDPQLDQPISFSVKINDLSAGKYFCRVTEKGQTAISNPVDLQVVVPVLGAYIVHIPNSTIIYEGAGLILICEVKRGSHLSFIWYHDQQRVSLSSRLYQISENLLMVVSANESHAGSYSCEVMNVVESNPRHSSSMEVTVVVKKYLSVPKVSFRLYRNGSGYHANISCWSVRGTPPVKFRLLQNGTGIAEQQVDSLEAWFPLPIVLGQDISDVQCVAENAVQQLLSDPVTLEVAPVGGTARVQVEYLHTADSVIAAVLLQCVITRGTFPIFSWSFNDNPLSQEVESHALTHLSNVLVLTQISAENSGYYSCRARDSFNFNSSWVESEKVLVRRTDFKLVSIEVFAMAFCTFLFVMVMGGACCLLRTISHERVATKTCQNMACGEQSNTEKCHATPEKQVEEMETVIMEVEI